MNDYDRINKIQKTDSIILETIDSFLKRGEIGLLKYGKTMDRDDKSLTEWIDEAIQEQMDSILYLTKIKKTIIENSNIYKREPPTFNP